MNNSKIETCLTEKEKFANVCMYVCVHACMCMYVCMYVCMSTNINACGGM